MTKTLIAVALMLGTTSVGSAQWVNYPNTVPRTRDGKPDLSARPPRTADGRPDLSGVWMADGQTYFLDLAAGLKADEVKPKPWAQALERQHEERLHADDPLSRCLPHGVPRVNTNGLFPYKIIQTPQLIVILYEQMHLFRQVFMDGRRLAPDPNPTWLGYSTGRWDGDVLVIDTTGFNGKAPLDTLKGRLATDSLHVTERFHRTSVGRLEVVATIDDPKTYDKPWTTTPQPMLLQLNTDLMEFECNENEKDLAHIK